MTNICTQNCRACCHCTKPFHDDTQSRNSPLTKLTPLLDFSYTLDLSGTGVLLWERQKGCNEWWTVCNHAPNYTAKCAAMTRRLAKRGFSNVRPRIVQNRCRVYQQASTVLVFGEVTKRKLQEINHSSG